MHKKYLIKLDGNLIGHTYFESHDAPMGVVFGNFEFYNIDSGYEYFRDYCKKHGVLINQDDSNHKLLSTQHIEGLEIISENGTAIKGEATSVGGSDEDGFEIEVIGIPYPFYREEFKHHVDDYDNQFS